MTDKIIGLHNCAFSHSRQKTSKKTMPLEYVKIIPSEMFTMTWRSSWSHLLLKRLIYVHHFFLFLFQFSIFGELRWILWTCTSTWQNRYYMSHLLVKQLETTAFYREWPKRMKTSENREEIEVEQHNGCQNSKDSLSSSIIPYQMSDPFSSFWQFKLAYNHYASHAFLRLSSFIVIIIMFEIM